MVITDPFVVYLVAAVIGLMVGSFLNVVILRTHRAMSFWGGRSKCLQCGHQLNWYDNIPLLSFAWLRGKCRHCSTSLSWQYPLVEGVTGILFALTAHTFGLTWLTVLSWLVVSLMVAIAVYDGRWSLLPDSFSISLAVAGIGFALSTHTVPIIDLGIGIVGGAVFFGLQFIISRGQWVGSGDIFLGGALGALLGWRMLGVALLVAYFSGAIVAAILLLTRRQSKKSALAFGPYLMLGGFIAWMYGEELVTWYMRTLSWY